MIAKKYLSSASKQLRINCFNYRKINYNVRPHKNNILNGNLASLWVIAGGLVVFGELWNKFRKVYVPAEEELPVIMSELVPIPMPIPMPTPIKDSLEPYVREHVSFMCDIFDALKQVRMEEHIEIGFNCPVVRAYVAVGISQLNITIFDDHLLIKYRFTGGSILRKEIKDDFERTIMKHVCEKYPNVESITANNSESESESTRDIIDFELRVTNYKKMFWHHSNYIIYSKYY